MAGDWISMRVNLPDDPRVVWVSAQLKCNACHVTGALHLLWSLADQHTDDGFLALYTPEIIDARVGLGGFVGLLASPQVQWVEIKNDGLQIVDFQRYNGTSGKLRCQTLRRVREMRQRRNAAAVTETLPENRTEQDIREDNTTQQGSATIQQRVVEFINESKHLNPASLRPKDRATLYQAIQLRSADWLTSIIEKAVKRRIPNPVDYVAGALRSEDFAAGVNDHAPRAHANKNGNNGAMNGGAKPPIGRRSRETVETIRARAGRST